MVILDLHGVLVSTIKMKENFRSCLIREYKQLGVDELTAVEYHEKGMRQFLDSMRSLSEKMLIDDAFLREMARIDTEWDTLMRRPIRNKKQAKTRIESRRIEDLAGRTRNALFPDAQDFLRQIRTFDDNWHFIIASNSHRIHVQSSISGFDSTYVDLCPCYGWEQFKCLKSHPEYFLRVRRLISTMYPGETEFFMVGDSSTEVLGAKNAEITPVLVHRDREIKKEIQDQAAHVIPDLKNLLAWLSNRLG